MFLYLFYYVTFFLSFLFIFSSIFSLPLSQLEAIPCSLSIPEPHSSIIYCLSTINILSPIYNFLAIKYCLFSIFCFALFYFVLLPYHGTESCLVPPLARRKKNFLVMFLYFLGTCFRLVSFAPARCSFPWPLASLTHFCLLNFLFGLDFLHQFICFLL